MDAEGDPVAFMDKAKEVKRARKDTLAEFSQWMLAEGYLSSDAPMDRTSILYRLRLELPWLEAGEDDLLVARRYLWAILPEPEAGPGPGAAEPARQEPDSPGPPTRAQAVSTRPRRYRSRSPG